MSIMAQIIIAEELETHQVGNNAEVNKLINPILKMRVPFIPAGLTFTISIITMGIDFTKDTNFSIAVIDPKKHNADEHYFLYDTGPQIIEGSSTNTTDNFNFNIHLKNTPFRREGIFKVAFKIDGQKFEQEFYVVADENLSKGT